MTPYWPSPLGATYRRLSPDPRRRSMQFSTELFGSRGPAAPRFPKRSSGITWIADADLPSSCDLDLGTNGAAPEPN